MFTQNRLLTSALAMMMLSASIFTSCRIDPNNPEDPDTPTPIDTLPVTLATRDVISNLDIPWEIVWGPDNLIWMTERNGRISKVNPETGQRQDLLSISEVRQQGEGGLLGMVLDPNFSANPHVYVAYTYNSPNGLREKVVRFTHNNNTLSDPRLLLEDIPASSIHNGARLLITRDRKLLVTTGDAANTSLPQNLSSLAGKVLRMNLDGSIPSDNPIPNSYIYTWGHRNAQGLAYHPNGNIYSSEHGPNTDDEFNRILANRNYGWPNVNGFVDPGAETNFATGRNIVEPLMAWTPTVATSDIAWYGSSLIPQWRNKFLMTTLKDQRLIAITLSADGLRATRQESFFDRQFGRLRDVLVAPDGRVFLATNSNPQRIVEIRPIKR
jgi:aldose sugar dehydrogenase